jgi:polar amino acid transport system ATP-binding protein
MEFARNISSRVFYMDEGTSYEEGSPTQIFENPQKEKTRAFIHRIRSVEHQITSPDYDLYAVQGEMEAFCNKHMLPRAITDRVIHITEEVLVIQRDFSDIRLSLSFSEKDGSLELSCRSAGMPSNPFDEGREEDEIPIRIIQAFCAAIEYRYEEGMNVFRLKLKREALAKQGAG